MRSTQAMKRKTREKGSEEIKAFLNISFDQLFAFKGLLWSVLKNRHGVEQY